MFDDIIVLLLQDKSLSDGIFFLELLSAVQPRVVNWSLVTKGATGMFSFFLKIPTSNEFVYVNFLSFIKLPLILRV